MNQPYQPSSALVLNVISDEYDIPFHAVAKSGVTDSVGAYQLKDGTADFIKSGIKVGMIVWADFSAPAKVVAVISPQILEIDSDIFGGPGMPYTIFSSPNPGALLWVAEENTTIRIVTLGGDMVVLKNVPRSEIIPIRVSRVYLSGTTATPSSIIALW